MDEREASNARQLRLSFPKKNYERQAFGVDESLLT
jgi:hypothetical protein